VQIRRSLTGAFLLLFLACDLQAQAARSYARVAEDLPALWKSRCPAQAESFAPDPQKRGILAAQLDGRIVYYYHFHAVVPVLVREGEEVKSRSTRTVELWVQYRPGAAYDLSFERMDRLPGQAKRWIR
jgi:hypothetical protein